MLEIPEDRCERHGLFKAIDDAFKAGDFEGRCGPRRLTRLVRRADAL
ncbi:hypothetical protein [Mesorhizobium sp. BHbdii]